MTVDCVSQTGTSHRGGFSLVSREIDREPEEDGVGSSATAS